MAKAKREYDYSGCPLTERVTAAFRSDRDTQAALNGQSPLLPPVNWPKRPPITSRHMLACAEAMKALGTDPQTIAETRALAAEMAQQEQA